MADAMDSKSIVRKGVRVQIPPPAPENLNSPHLWAILILDSELRELNP